MRTREKVYQLEEVSRDKEREMGELQVSLQEAQQQDRDKTRVLESLQVQLTGMHILVFSRGSRLSLFHKSEKVKALDISLLLIKKLCNVIISNNSAFS